MRLFTAILLPEVVREHLVAARRELVRGVGEHEIRFPAPDTLHVTLNFIGEVDAGTAAQWVDRLSQVEVRPASVFADGFLFLPPRGPVRVIAGSIGGEAERLVELNAGIAAIGVALGLPREARRYTPHITVGRNGNGRYAKVAGQFRQRIPPHVQALWPGPTWRVEHFALVQSTLKPSGPEYRTIATFSTV